MRARGAICLSGRAKARSVAASWRRSGGLGLPPLRPARPGRLTGNRGALLLGKFAGARRAALESAEAAERNGSGILCRGLGRRIGCGRPFLGKRGIVVVAARLVCGGAFGHSGIMQPPSERCKHGKAPASQDATNSAGASELSCKPPNCLTEADFLAKPAVPGGAMQRM